MSKNDHFNIGCAKISEIESCIKYTFKNKNLLIEALSHPSLNKKILNRIFNYERLEFLGDSILNFVITSILISEFTFREGVLAKIRSYLISKNIVYKIALSLNLGDYILMSKGEDLTGGRKSFNNLENSMEALIGAIYLDSTIEDVYKWVHLMWGEYINYNKKELLDFDPKSKLQEILQERKLDAPFYKTENEENIGHEKMFTVSVNFCGNAFFGNARNKKEAQKMAAQNALMFICENHNKQ